jgi:formate-nitrite transporter family protein
MAADQTERGDDGSGPLPAGTESPHLGPGEREQAATHAPLRALVIHEVLREEGEFELRRPPAALLWSGLAAGLSMGFSFLTLALLQAYLPDQPWRRVLASFGYSVGFVIVVLGQQQLFTETTLTAMLPVFYQPRWKSVGILLRMWAIVLFANIAGTIAFAGLLSRHDLFNPQIRQALSAAAAVSIGDGAVPMALKAMLAGWMIALMVWVLPSARSAGLFVIVLMTYVIALGQFSHIVAGSTEAAFAVLTGEASVGDYVMRFFLPTILGNLIGGVALAALLNHAPVAHEIAAKASDQGDA